MIDVLLMYVCVHTGMKDKFEEYLLGFKIDVRTIMRCTAVTPPDFVYAEILNGSICM